MADDLQTVVQRMIDAGESEENIATVIQHFSAPAPQSQPTKESGIGLAAGSVPIAGHLVQELATNPGVPHAGSILGQIAGGVEGAVKGGPLGAAGGAWAGGRAGWFTGKLAQRLARPVAAAADYAAPVLRAVGVAGAAQGVNDLAQMAEPNRKDIGVFGIGGGTPDPQHPALLNAIYESIRKRLAGQP